MIFTGLSNTLSSFISTVSFYSEGLKPIISSSLQLRVSGVHLETIPVVFKSFLSGVTTQGRPICKMSLFFRLI